MKRLLLSAVVLMGLGFISQSANAQMGMGAAPPDLVNCSGLNGVSAICLKNYSQSMITGVQTATSMSWGSNWIPLSIPPGGTQVIRIPSGWSGQVYMEVNTTGGSHVINGGRSFDIIRTTVVNIRW